MELFKYGTDLPFEHVYLLSGSTVRRSKVQSTKCKELRPQIPGFSIAHFELIVVILIIMNNSSAHPFPRPLIFLA
jgi:hypothetical protein